MHTLTVTELANSSNMTPHAVRYYTRIGLLRPERNPNNGYRLYRYSDVDWLRFIHRAKWLGYTLNEIKAIMEDATQGHSPCPRVREILLRRIDANRRQLEEMRILQDRMEQAMKQWSNMPDGIPDGHSVCHLIESFGEDDGMPDSDKH